MIFYIILYIISLFLLMVFALPTLLSLFPHVSPSQLIASLNIPLYNMITYLFTQFPL